MGRKGKKGPSGRTLAERARGNIVHGALPQDMLDGGWTASSRQARLIVNLKPCNKKARQNFVSAVMRCKAHHCTLIDGFTYEVVARRDLIDTFRAWSAVASVEHCLDCNVWATLRGQGASDSSATDRQQYKDMIRDQKLSRATLEALRHADYREDDEEARAPLTGHTMLSGEFAADGRPLNETVAQKYDRLSAALADRLADVDDATFMIVYGDPRQPVICLAHDGICGNLPIDGSEATEEHVALVRRGLAYLDTLIAPASPDMSHADLARDDRRIEAMTAYYAVLATGDESTAKSILYALSQDERYRSVESKATNGRRKRKVAPAIAANESADRQALALPAETEEEKKARQKREEAHHVAYEKRRARLVKYTETTPISSEDDRAKSGPKSNEWTETNGSARPAPKKPRNKVRRQSRFG
jgi:hypothetical protein